MNSIALDFIVLDEISFNRMLENFSQILERVEILSKKYRTIDIQEWLDTESVYPIKNITNDYNRNQTNDYSIICQNADIQIDIFIYKLLQ